MREGVWVFIRKAKQLRSEAKEGNHLGAYPSVNHPLGPFLGVDLEFQVHETVPQGVAFAW